MAVDYATLKKGGFRRQKQKNNFSLRLRVVGGNLTAKQLAKISVIKRSNNSTASADGSERHSQNRQDFR